MPLYEEKLINPLAVRFSQDRIWPDFQDGHRIEDSLVEITSVPYQGVYDVVLRPPFPPMEIIRLKQERREGDGERMRDEKGHRLWGEESWFTFDNRRLYCLQRAALKLWPVVVAVVVKVLFDFPAVRCARHKFRTTSDGRSVKISLPDGNPGCLWNWLEAAQLIPAMPDGITSVMEAVRTDVIKTGKEQLVELPSAALLCPGTRERTVAERFNLGSSRTPDHSDAGKAAGQQLLNLLTGAEVAPDAKTSAPGVQADAWQSHEDQWYPQGAWQWNSARNPRDRRKGEGKGVHGKSKGHGKGKGSKGESKEPREWPEPEGPEEHGEGDEKGANGRPRRRRKPKGRGGEISASVTEQ